METGRGINENPENESITWDESDLDEEEVGEHLVFKEETGEVEQTRLEPIKF
jgi:hypothetical protein